MNDLIKDSIDQAQNIALAGMKGGYEIATRESAAKLAEKDAAIAELREAARFVVDNLPGALSNALGRTSYDTGWQASTLAERELSNLRTVLARHAPILPNLHSHHDRAELLRDEYPDKYAGLKADAIRENGDTK